MKIPRILKLSRKKLIILTVIIILAVAGFGLFGKKKQTPLQFATVKRQNIKSTVSSSGNLTGKDTVNLKFQSSGKLAYINVKISDEVVSGKVIAGLDVQELNISLQQAQNTLRDKQAIVDKIHDDVKDHDKDESFTQKQNRTTAEVARDNAYDEIKAARRAFQDAVLISPIGGIITQVNFISGQNVSVADLIVQIVDNSSIYFDTDIDEADIGKVSKDQISEITLDAYSDKIFKGVVDQILPQTKTTSSGATVVTVRIKLLDSPTTFVNGLSGQAIITLESKTNVLTIPLESLREDQTVVVEENNHQLVKKVKKGISSDLDIEILEGLNEGEKVLLNPPAK